MRPWNQRPREIAYLFNPAFCALVLREVVSGFVEEVPTGMSYPLLFLVLPIVLHKATREALPRSVATKMHPWIQEHEEARIGFARRCAGLAPYTREAVLFACLEGLLAFSAGGMLVAPRKRLPRTDWGSDFDCTVCMERARFVGRWLATAGDNATVLAMWGVRP